MAGPIAVELCCESQQRFVSLSGVLPLVMCPYRQGAISPQRPLYSISYIAMAMQLHASLSRGCSLGSPAKVAPQGALPKAGAPNARVQALLKPAGCLLAPLSAPVRVSGLSRSSSLTCRASGDVLTIGSTGQTCSRIVVQLLKNGFKVQAGVDTDLGEAQEVVGFAKKLEIISSADASALRPRALNVLDPDDIAQALG